MPYYFVPGTRTQGAEGQFDLALLESASMKAQPRLGLSFLLSEVISDGEEEVEVPLHLISTYILTKEADVIAARLLDGLISLIAELDAYVRFIDSEPCEYQYRYSQERIDSLARIKRAREIMEAIKAS